MKRFFSNYHLWGLLVFWVTLTGLILRLIRLTHCGIWLDETFTFYNASLDLNQWQFTIPHGDIQNAPFYLLLMHFWIKLFGSSPMALRLPSVLASTFTIPFIYLAMKKWDAPRTAAMLIAFLLAISPAHIYYAQEARSYAILLFFLVIALYFLGGWIKQSTAGYLCGFLFISVISFYTSLWAVFWLVAFNGIVGWYYFEYQKLLSSKNTFLMSWILSQICIAILTVPYLIYLFLNLGLQGQGLTSLSYQSNIWIDTLLKLGLGVEIKYPKESLAYAGPILLVGFLLGVIGGIRTQKQLDNNYLKIGLIVLFTPLILFYLFSLFKPIYMPDRYGIICLPGYLIVIGGGLSFLLTQKRWAGIGIGLLLLLLIGLSQSIRVTYQIPKVHLREVAQYIQQNVPPTDVIAFSPGYWQINYDYYDNSVQPRIQLNSEKDVKNKNEYPRLWLITIPYTPPSPQVTKRLEQIYSQPLLMKSFPPHYINLYLYK